MTEVASGHANSNGSRASSSNDDESSTSLHENYRLNDSDSDEDDENDVPISAAAHIQELEELKLQTKTLLDVEWKKTISKQLLNKMFELDEPSVSPKMVDFLLQDGICEALVATITCVGDRPRPKPTENDSIELRNSYRCLLHMLDCMTCCSATMMLTSEEPSDALLSFLNRKASLIARSMFDIFRTDSAGSFYHAARILESLLRSFPGEVFDAICSDGKLQERMTAMLKYIGYSPVGDLLVVMVALTPISRSSPVYSMCAKQRWHFFTGLSEWIFMLRLAEIVVHPEEHCYCDDYITPEQHSAAAAQTLQDLVEKLSIEDLGEILLQPLGYTVELMDHLVNVACKHEDEPSESLVNRRRASLRLLIFLLKRSSNPENICFFVTAAGSPPTPQLVPNRLHPLRPLLLKYLHTRSSDILGALLATTLTAAKEPVVHPGHVTTTPFSSHRAQLVELLVLMVEADETVSVTITVELWKHLIIWNFDYPHNNIYQALFYRLLFAVLRQNNETTLRNLFKEAKIVTFLVDYLSSLPRDSASSLGVDQRALRGIVMNASNAIRLQSSSLPPGSFLRQYLNSHSRWAEFVPSLRAATEDQLTPGLGLPLPERNNGNGMHHLTSLLSAAQEPAVEGIDHGSRFAKSLGFDVEMEWPVEASELNKKKKKKSKKKKKKNHRRRSRAGSVEDEKQRNSTASSNSDDKSDEDDEDGEDEEDFEDLEDVGEENYEDEMSSSFERASLEEENVDA